MLLCSAAQPLRPVCTTWSQTATTPVNGARSPKEKSCAVKPHRALRKRAWHGSSASLARLRPLRGSPRAIHSVYVPAPRRDSQGLNWGWWPSRFTRPKNSSAASSGESSRGEREFHSERSPVLETWGLTMAPGQTRSSAGCEHDALQTIVGSPLDFPNARALEKAMGLNVDPASGSGSSPTFAKGRSHLARRQANFPAK